MHWRWEPRLAASLDRPLVRYCFALVAVGAGALMRLVLWQALRYNVPFVTFYPAVMLAALVAGFGPGILAAALSALLAGVWLIPPVGRFTVSGLSEIWSLLLFLLMGLFMSAVGDMYLRARRRSAEYETQLAVRDTERRYQELVQNANSAIIRWRRDGAITFFNEYAQRLFGYSEEEVLGKDVRMLVPETESSGGDLSTLVHDITAHPDDFHTHVNENLLRDGRRVWMSWTNRPLLDENGGLSEVLAVGSDITKLKQAEEALRASEEQFRTMADAISQLAWMANPDGYIFWYNQRWYDYTGTTPEQMEGWGWQSVPDPNSLPAVMERWKASIASGEPFDMEYALRGTDGKYRPFLTRAVPLKGSHGEVIRWFGTNTDMSQVRELEAHKREFYRRTILAATDGKLLISEKQDIIAAAGPELASWTIDSRENAAVAIVEAGRMIDGSGIEEQRAYEFLGCIDEALANVLKHATNGKLSMHSPAGALFCLVTDAGPGIGALALPDVALKRNYSTAGTLGMGYKLMIRFADLVYLATGPEGTTLGIQINLDKAPTDSGAATAAAHMG